VSLSARTRLAAVVGRPVSHSLSPIIHNAWLQAAGIEAAYLAFAPRDEAVFAVLVEGLRSSGGLGLNITAPFKGLALKWAELNGADIEPAAMAAASVNLLVFGPERARAASTDGLGMIGAIGEQAPDLDIAAGPVVVLGAGGAGRAAVAALKAAGVSDIRVVNRTLTRAEDLAGAAGSGVSAWSLGSALEALDGSHLLINAATGMEPPDLTSMAASGAVLDMTYRPLKTDLLAAAAGRGLTPVDGLAMLIAQARPSFEALFGQPAPQVDVRNLCRRAMEAGG